MIIAQISDPHVKEPGRLAYRVVDTSAALARVVAAVSETVPRPDICVVTGDLVDLGRPVEYAQLRALLKPLAMPVYVIPGNHDERQALRAAFAEDGYMPAAGEFIQYTVERHPVRLVALDTIVPGEGGGLLCAERLAWLDARLGEARDRPTVVLMHHPPFRTYIRHMDELGLDGADAFAAVIARHPQVERVLCGHLHRAIQFRLGRSTIASTCPGTSHQVVLDLRPEGASAFRLEPPGWQLHVWDEGQGIVSHTGVIGDFPGPYPFHDGGKLIS
jgi:3',5'-cyclic AMP phosphodiesterase CpdA